MEITVYNSGDKGKVLVTIRGSSKNSAKQVAKAYLEVKEELDKGGVKCQ